MRQSPWHPWRKGADEINMEAIERSTSAILALEVEPLKPYELAPIMAAYIEEHEEELA
jgi:hypothetical protein